MRNKLSVEDLRRFAETFVAKEPGRLGSAGWWQTPRLAAAPVDARFDRLPQIAAQLLEQNFTGRVYSLLRQPLIAGPGGFLNFLMYQGAQLRRCPAIHQNL